MLHTDLGLSLEAFDVGDQLVDFCLVVMDITWGQDDLIAWSPDRDRTFSLCNVDTNCVQHDKYSFDYY